MRKRDVEFVIRSLHSQYMPAVSILNLKRVQRASAACYRSISRSAKNTSADRTHKELKVFHITGILAVFFKGTRKQRGLAYTKNLSKHMNERDIRAAFT